MREKPPLVSAVCVLSAVCTILYELHSYQSVLSASACVFSLLAEHRDNPRDLDYRGLEIFDGSRKV